MQILILTPQIPWPPHQGASLRNFNIVQGLVDGGAQVAMLSFAEEAQLEADLTPLISLLNRFETVPVPERTSAERLKQMVTSPIPDMGHRLFAPDFFAKLEKLLADLKPAVVQIEGIELARAIETVREHRPKTKIVFDNHNAETALQKRIYETDIQNWRKLPKAMYSRVQVNKLDKFEQWACQESDVVTAVSERDAEILQAYRRPDQTPVTHIPNCIDVSEFGMVEPEREIAYDLVFTGKMDYRPNVDGMLWFTDEIWPLIKEARPDTTLAIVGKNPAPSIEFLDYLDGVTVTGGVAEIAPWLNCSRIMIMPLRMGSGTRLKLIQGLAAGLPIVSTTNGAEGYPAKDGKELLIGDSPEEFAAQVGRLLVNRERQRLLGQNGRAFAEAYDWRRVVPKFLDLYQT